MMILVSIGCGDDKKSATDPNNGTNNGTNNTNNGTNGTNNSTNGTNNGTVNISDYDQTCEFDGDCALVASDPCGCSCPTLGINANDQAAFNGAVSELGCTGPVCDVACAEALPACWKSTCYAREPQYIRAEDFDNSCDTAADCMYIATGEVCDECLCAGTPVNRESYEANPPVVVAECTPGPFVCDCASPPAIACNEGVCGFAD